jgi:predicted small secreted protein
VLGFAAGTGPAPHFEQEHGMRNVIVAAVAACALTLGACNTVSGAGEDLQSASKAVENEIN